MTDENESDNQEENKLVKSGPCYGVIDSESQFYDDSEEMEKNELLNIKITKIKIYTGIFNDKKAIFGIGYTRKNMASGKILEEKVIKGNLNFEDVKELEIHGDEYLTDFHVRFPNDGDYLSQLGFETSKKNKILEGTEDGEDKTIQTNGGDNIIIGFFGHYNKKLDALGYLYVPKKEFMKKTLFRFFMLRYKFKKDAKFKEEWEKKYKELPLDYQYIWKTINLSDALYFSIIKYCYM